MTMRTSTRTVTFRRPFVLGRGDDPLPPGSYTVETDIELLDGITMQASRRIQTLIYLRHLPGHPGATQIVAIDPDDLEAALQRDRTSKDVAIGNDAEPEAS